MNTLGFRLPLLCLVGMGLVGCSAAGEASAGPGSDDGISAGAAKGTWGELDAHQVGDGARDDEPLRDVPGPEVGDAPGGGHEGSSCDRGIDLPGVSIDSGDDGITIVVALPNDGSIIIETKEGRCTARDGGLDVTGDVAIDLGSGSRLPLLDAELHVGADGAMPTVEGAANVDGSLLEGITLGSAGDLRVGVALDLDVTQNMPESDAFALLQLRLELPRASVGCGCFPALDGDLGMLDAQVIASVDGVHKVVRATALADDHGGALWTSMVPLHATGRLTATATLADGELLAIGLDGDMASDAGKLWCGLTPLLSIALPEAKLTLDRRGATLSAVAHASLHPGYSLTGQAQLGGTFTQHEWSLTLCGGAMADLTLASAQLAACLNLSAAGAKSCDQPLPG